MQPLAKSSLHYLLSIVGKTYAAITVKISLVLLFVKTLKVVANKNVNPVIIANLTFGSLKRLKNGKGSTENRTARRQMMTRAACLIEEVE
jgi:hypothetical protein